MKKKLDINKQLVVSVFIAILLNTSNIYGQQQNMKHVTDTLHASDFNKVPVTFLYRCNNEDYAKIMSDIIDSLYECEGIIKNNTDIKRIGLSKDTQEKELLNSYNINTAHYLKEDIYNNEIIYACFNCDNNGILDFNRIRKKLELEDGELTIPNSNFSTLEILKIAAELLMNNSYIIVFDLSDVSKPKKTDLQADKLKAKYSYTLSAFLYKIDFNHDMATYFFHDLEQVPEDSASQDWSIADKLNKHSLKISFEQKYDLRKQTIVINNSGEDTYKEQTLEKAIKKSADKLLSKIYIKQYSNNTYSNIIIPDHLYIGFNKIIFIDQNNHVYKLTNKITRLK